VPDPFPYSLSFSWTWFLAPRHSTLFNIAPPQHSCSLSLIFKQSGPERGVLFKFNSYLTCFFNLTQIFKYNLKLSPLGYEFWREREPIQLDFFLSICNTF
jgi:hypothetical protein